VSTSQGPPPVEPIPAVPIETPPSPTQAEPGKDAPGTEGPPTETITEPAKLLRIASMVRELLEETRHASMDEAGRKRLVEIYHRSVDELGDSVSKDLKDELQELVPPLDGVPTESEMRVAQAQLVGWLEGLFHGIQAAMFAQQMAARQQFEEIRRRGLMAQNPQQEQPGGPPRGQYL
jgi:proteasome activator-like protein